ncbi:MAG: hypothetical protein JO316_18055 [Abitibacteriaceae bacterium]|nr:hypothetical protein [Abditibacteriaceae bacterium]MBV9867263.1 hypothetical protein [Abditibacteriaceae bacterium]
MRNTRIAQSALIAFWPLTALVLYCDAQPIARLVPGGQELSNLIAFLYLSILISQMRPSRRLLAVLFVPLSAIGEAIFTLVFGLYHYRLNAIPLYVPLGHSILLSVGLSYADRSLWRVHKRTLQQALLLFHALLIGGTLLLFHDILSALLLAVFLIVLWQSRSRSRTTYLVIGGLVLYIELLGTMWGCWRWEPFAFGVLRTTNPPLGAFACYVIADIIAVKMAALVGSWCSPLHIPRLTTAPCEVEFEPQLWRRPEQSQASSMEL